MEEVLIATRAIDVGEELNDCYIHLLQSRAKRKSQLQEIYGFDCQCMACSQLEFQSDDTRRVKAAELEELIIEVAAESGPEVAMELCTALIRILESDSSIGWGGRYQGKAMDLSNAPACAH